MTLYPNDHFDFKFLYNGTNEWDEQGVCKFVENSKDGRCYIFGDLNELDRFKKKIIIPMHKFPKGHFTSFGIKIVYEFTLKT